MIHARRLVEEARPADERRVLVLTGDREDCRAAAIDALDAAGLDRTTVLADETVGGLPAEHLDPDRAGELLGRTRDCVVLDAHDALEPNALGRAVGAVDGGGLLVLLAPDLDDWPDRRDGFDERLAVPPFGVEDVAGNFRHRLVRTIRKHRGVSVVDAATGEVLSDGRTDPPPRRPPAPPEIPDGSRLPTEAYAACLTADQSAAVEACESLLDGAAVVIEADRGRGKSSACGLAAGALAADGDDVVVTGPGYRATTEVFARAEELLADLDALAGTDDREVRATGGGRVRYVPAADAAEAGGDAVVVDEAASLPVRVLSAVLDSGAPVAFATTVHGYEGAGRGFSVRFRDHLEDSEREVVDCSMADPIRYAPGDPVEVWAFRALLLDAGPPVEQVVADASPETTEYVDLDPENLLADEHLLREAFGLLVLAHYRTEPNDLARLLDAPNIEVRALRHDGHVAAVALLAREGDLSGETRQSMYEGARVRGNMLPDVLTSQLRDETAGVPEGLRVVRIATHHAVRSRGLGSKLLDEIREEFSALDYLGVGYGATPGLVDFWADNGFRTVHLSTSRNDASGEYSVLMVDPLSDAGYALHDRSADFFARRIASVLADPLDDADPDVVRAALAATDAVVPLDLSDREWRVVASAAYGPGLYDVAPRPFRRLALHHLLAGDADATADAERLLVAKALQSRPWSAVRDDLGFVSRRETLRTFGDACKPLVDAYGTEAAREEAARYR